MKGATHLIWESHAQERAVPTGAPPGGDRTSAVRTRSVVFCLDGDSGLPDKVAGNIWDDQESVLLGGDNVVPCHVHCLPLDCWIEDIKQGPSISHQRQPNCKSYRKRQTQQRPHNNKCSNKPDSARTSLEKILEVRSKGVHTNVHQAEGSNPVR